MKEGFIRSVRNGGVWYRGLRRDDVGGVEGEIDTRHEV